MSGILENKLNIEKVIETLKKYTNDGTDEKKLKTLGITKLGYKVYIQKEMTPSFSMILKLAIYSNIDIDEFYILSIN